MVGFLVFGTLTAVLVAELYVLCKRDEKELLEKEEHKCNCGCCHNEDEVEIVDSLGNKCGHGCDGNCKCGCNKEEE